MGRSGRRFAIGCGGLLAAVAISVVVVPLTRGLLTAVATGEPVGDDLRPLSYHIARLDDPDPAFRLDAINRISVLKGQTAPAVPALLALARDPVRGGQGEGQTALRVLALRVVSGVRPPAAAHAAEVADFLKYPDVWTRMAAAQALCDMGSDARAAVPALRAAFPDEFAPVNKEVYAAMSRIDRSELAPMTRTALRHPKHYHRLAALEYAEKTDPDGRVFADDVKALSESDPDPQDRSDARKLLRRWETKR
jgi:HEAT repeat protein